jgi:hypothetical protein
MSRRPAVRQPFTLGDLVGAVQTALRRGCPLDAVLHFGVDEEQTEPRALQISCLTARGRKHTLAELESLNGQQAERETKGGES